MRKILVDTNVFLRWIIDDGSRLHTQASTFFNNTSRNTVRLYASLITFFEIEWVLSSSYNVSKSDRVAIFSDILSLDFINFDHKEILLKALDYFNDSNIELEDCFNIFYAKALDIGEFFTFDKKLKKHI